MLPGCFRVLFSTAKEVLKHLTKHGIRVKSFRNAIVLPASNTLLFHAQIGSRGGSLVLNKHLAWLLSQQLLREVQDQLDLGEEIAPLLWHLGGVSTSNTNPGSRT